MSRVDGTTLAAAHRYHEQRCRLRLGETVLAYAQVGPVSNDGIALWRGDQRIVEVRVAYNRPTALLVRLP